MSETYTSGSWVVKSGEEDAFELPEFVERIGRVRSHCEDFKPSTFELVTQIS